MENWKETLTPFLTQLAGRLLGALCLLFFGRLLIRLIRKAVQNRRFSKRVDPTVYRFTDHFLSITLNLLLIVSIVGVLGVPLSSVIALIASAGVAVGLALQGALGNLAGGVMILLFRPFRLEDYIEVDDFGGTVKDIGIFYTVLDTPDHRVVTIPNGTITGKEVVNYSAKSERRLEIKVPMAYGSDPNTVRDVLLESAKRDARVLADPAPAVRLSEYGENALIFLFRVWTKREDFWDVKFDLTEDVARALKKHGLEIPYRQLDLHIKGEKTNDEQSISIGKSRKNRRTGGKNAD